MQDRHDAGSLQLQVFSHAVLKHLIVRHGLRLGDAAQLHEHLDGFGSEAAAPQSGDGYQARIIPSVHDAVLNQLLDVALAGNDILEIHLRKLDLSGRLLVFKLPHDPVVQRSVILEFQRADRMGDAFDRILDRMGKIIHRVDAPFVSRILMGDMGDAVDDRISHVHVRGRHVDLRPQHLGAVLIHAILHVLEEFQVLFHRAVPVGRILTGLCQGSPVFPDLLRGKVTDKCLALFDQGHGCLIHLIEVIRRKIKTVVKLRPEPSDVILDGLDELALLLRRIRIIETQIEQAIVFLCQTVVQKDRLRMPDVKVSVRLRRESRHHMVDPSLFQVLVNDLLDKVLALVFHTLLLLDVYYLYCA